MASGGPSVGPGPSDATREPALAQPPTVRARVSAAASETREGMRGVVIVSSRSGNGALGALFLNAQNAAKPTHGCCCPMGQSGFSPQPRATMPITPLPDAPSSAPSATHGHEAHAVTELLRAWGAGDAGACEALVPLVYAELRRQARHMLRREG